MEWSASLGCDYYMSTAICVICFFFCQALGRLGGRQALKLFRFGGFSFDATVSRFMFFAAFGFFDHREKGDDD